MICTQGEVKLWLWGPTLLHTVKVRSACPIWESRARLTCSDTPVTFWRSATLFALVCDEKQKPQLSSTVPLGPLGFKASSCPLCLVQRLVLSHATEGSSPYPAATSRARRGGFKRKGNDVEDTGKSSRCRGWRQPWNSVPVEDVWIFNGNWSERKWSKGAPQESRSMGQVFAPLGLNGILALLQ